MSGDYFVVRKGATALRNEVVYDENLSYAALGLLARALASPPGAKLGYRAFVGRGLGEKAVRTCLRELDEAGYRWMFRVRQASGSIATVTVFFDVPATQDEAFADAMRMVTSGRIFDCLTESLRLRRSHRAADGAARSDLWECGVDSEPVDNLSEGDHRAAHAAARSDLGKHAVSPDGTAQRLTAARSSAALSRREIKSSSLRSELLSDQTRPAREPVPDPPGRDGRVGSGPVRDDSPSRGGAPSAPAARLVADCLPEWMQALDADGARAVGALLAERVGAGWRPSEIRQTMGDAPAGGVTRMAGLACSRLRRNVDPALAPARLRAEAEAARRGRRRGAGARGLPAVPEDPEWAAAWAWAEGEHPDASGRDLARLAEARMAELRGGEGA